MGLHLLGTASCRRGHSFKVTSPREVAEQQEAPTSSPFAPASQFVEVEPDPSRASLPRGDGLVGVLVWWGVLVSGEGH